jgi:hypothetical protein
MNVYCANRVINLLPSTRASDVSFDKARLADETDVDRYLIEINKAIIAEFRRGKRIQI